MRFLRRRRADSSSGTAFRPTPSELLLIVLNQDLTSGVLSQADLRSADLRYAQLSAADLSGADLRYADLRHANLSLANLRAADLRGADLRGAVVQGANMFDVRLERAQLSGCAGMPVLLPPNWRCTALGIEPAMDEGGPSTDELRIA